tara:strand:- start:1429 stop:1629 length:201 start_codon:yes stop_codon:yes gene_type:complete
MKTSSLKEMLDKIDAHERLIEKLTSPDCDDFDERADHEYELLRDRRDEEELDNNNEYLEDDTFNGE